MTGLKVGAQGGVTWQAQRPGRGMNRLDGARSVVTPTAQREPGTECGDTHCAAAPPGRAGSVVTPTAQCSRACGHLLWPR